MGLKKRQILETSLFDSEQIVTVQYLSRHADISVDDAKNELTDFLTENRDRTELHAVYVLSGELRAPDASSSSNANDTATTCKRRCTELVRDCHLESTQQAYSELGTCEIYCLHTKPIKTFNLLYSVDSLNDVEYVRADPEHSWLSHPEAEAKREEMMEQHGAVLMPEEEKQTGPQKEVIASTSESSEVVPKKRKNDLASMFAQVAAQNKQKKQDPAKKGTIQPKQENAGEKTNITSGQTVRHRGQRILIDNEEQDVKEDAETKGIANKESVTTQSKSLISEGKKEQSSLLVQDDIFSDGDSSPERMDLDQGEKTVEENEKEIPKKSRPSPCIITKDGGFESGTVQESQKKTRKEHVTETFLDNDGFMVTKEVLKEIEVDQSSADAPTEEHKKLTSVKLAESKTQKTTKVPQGQARISSFFQKK